MNVPEKMIALVTSWLEKPIKTNLPEANAEGKKLLESLQKQITEKPEEKRTLGPLFGKVKSMLKSLDDTALLGWKKTGNGDMALGHRPSNKLIRDLKLQNTTAVFCLLSKKEGADDIKAEVLKAKMSFLGFPMSSANPINEERNEELFGVLKTLKEELDKGGRIYIHCSAGIHRTGMIGYAFLRYLGFNEDEALKELSQLRSTTAKNVGDGRLEWAESFLKGAEKYLG